MKFPWAERTGLLKRFAQPHGPSDHLDSVENNDVCDGIDNTSRCGHVDHVKAVKEKTDRFVALSLRR